VTPWIYTTKVPVKNLLPRYLIMNNAEDPVYFIKKCTLVLDFKFK